MTFAGELCKAFPAAYFIKVREFFSHTAIFENTLVVLCSNFCKVIAGKQRFREEVGPGHHLSYHLIVVVAVLHDVCVKVVEATEIELVKIVGIEERAVSGGIVEVYAVAAVVQIQATLLHVTNEMLNEYEVETCIFHLADAGSVLLGVGGVALAIAGKGVKILPVFAILGRINGEDAGVNHIVREVVRCVTAESLSAGDI